MKTDGVGTEFDILQKYEDVINYLEIMDYIDQNGEWEGITNGKFISLSWSSSLDFVHAIEIIITLDECEYLFHKCFQFNEISCCFIQIFR